PRSCWWVPTFRQTLSRCQQRGQLPGAVSQEESQGREIPFHRGVVDGQRSRVGGCRGVAASEAEEPLDHLVVTETGCQVQDGGTRVVCVLQEEVGRLSVPGTSPSGKGVGDRRGIPQPGAGARRVGRTGWSSVRTERGRSRSTEHRSDRGTSSSASIKGLRPHTVSAAQCPPCSEPLTLFHYSEYLVTAINNPRSLSLDSFLLNHSFEYNLAALSSWVEFTLEKLFFPELKQITWLSTVGLLMVIFGDCLRKAAMLTAGSNFNHIVQNEKSDTHTLVTSGVYGWFRHPSYVGWFYWSIGTQVLLCNPICVVGYALASWRFFRERIEEEEITLIHFFGEEYLEYKRKVPSGLPFIKGVKLEL
uniref:Protein-S-isoprenylcysteine O-methyltransferase n=1 Tax=Zonotrichia albicollis TaxID=44394 RepID=A0A8D2M0B9_ZONAL